MSESLWSKTTNTGPFPALRKDVKTDVLIIGGGICGILCAYFLQQKGVDCMLVEKAGVGSGVTRNTTAKVTSQHGLIYHRLLHSLGRERASMYLNANQAAVDAYRELAETISCDFEDQQAGVYSRDNRQRIEAELQALQTLGFPAGFTDRLQLCWH